MNVTQISSWMFAKFSLQSTVVILLYFYVPCYSTAVNYSHTIVTLYTACSSIQLQLGSYTYIPYRRKFSRHEKFAKSLKTGFLHLFVRETTPDIRKSHANIKIV